MSPDARFQTIIALLTLVFAVMASLLGFVVRVSMRWTRTEDKLGTLVDEVRELIIRKDKDHEAIRTDVAEREARGNQAHAALGDRLTYLERRELEQRRRQDG